MVLATAAARALGVESGARLRFGEQDKPEGAWAGERLLFLDEKPAFELSFWCGTCPFLFKRREGANDKLALAALEQRLADGVDGLDDDVIDTYASLLPAGDYFPLLVELRPRLVRPLEPGDYYAEEQVATWGVETFWDLPQYPRTPYYRTFETSVDSGAHLYEFVVPMVPPSWNDAARVAEHATRLRASSRPTAVAVSTLDVCAPATLRGPDYYAHWGLTHFLLDGHHKLQAAAENDTPLRLLSLLSIAASLAQPEEVARVPELRARHRAVRSAHVA
jgi:hypothetical protein